MNVMTSTQEKRIALLIGNSDYGAGNEVSGEVNAIAMEEALKDLGFEIHARIGNANRETFNQALEDFAGSIEDAQVVLFFYSGHGLQLDNRNYLVPTDSALRADELVAVDDLIQSLGDAPAEAVKLVFLDACREDTRLPMGAPRGMANPSPAPPNTLQAFSASPNQLAESGARGNKSVYTNALLSLIPVAGLPLPEALHPVGSRGVQLF